MANLSRDEGDRGQLILVTAFMLAVTFVALALVVNSAIFTENMATRDDVAGSHEALDHRSEVQTNVGTVLKRINNQSTPTKGNLTENIQNLSDAGGLQQATQGRLVNVSFDKKEDGLRIAQDNSSRSFTNKTGAEDWALTDASVQDIRNVVINVTDPPDTSYAGTSAFEFVVNDTSPSGTQWKLTIEENDTLSDSIDIIVHSPNHGDEKTCTRDHHDSNPDYTLIDVTSGVIDGEPCPALDRLDDGTKMWLGAGVDDPYRIEFVNGYDINGTYSFVLGGSASQGNGLENGKNSDDPYYNSAFYSVTVSYEFYTSAVGYETDIRVAPGEVSS